MFKKFKSVWNKLEKLLKKNIIKRNILFSKNDFKKNKENQEE